MNYDTEIFQLKNRIDNIERRVIDKSPCDRLRDIVDKHLDEANTFLNEPLMGYNIESLEKRAYLKGFKARAQLMKRELDR